MNPPNQSSISKLPFAAEKDSLLFCQEVIKLLIKEFDKRRQKYVPTENFQTFHHGTGWSFQRHEKEGLKPHFGELEHVSTPCEVKLDRIKAGDMNLIADFVRETADKMEEGLVARLAETVNATAEGSGNIVSFPSEGSLAEAFLEAINAIQVGVARDGSVSRPAVFLSDPSILKRLQRDLNEGGPELHKRLEAARKEQEQKALAREKERLARFDVE